MAYQSEKEIFEIVRGFENGTIKREDWRHAEHLTVACCYAFQHDYEIALRKMRDGIFNLLDCFGVDLSTEMPYHETLTVFWMRTIFDSMKNPPEASLVEFANRILEIGGDKDLPLKSYSRELLFSDPARKNYVEGDL
jgi:hypothetical protein